ncbi:MAG: transglycosylase SLT domain-containing protein [Myxococcota bacterium]
MRLTGSRWQHLRLAFVSLVSLVLMLPASADAQDSLAELVRRHQHRAALAHLARRSPSERQRPELRYLEGRLLLRTGEVEAAAPLLDGAGLPSFAQPKARFLRAFALARSGACSAAAPLLREAGRSGSWAPLARALAAECVLQMGDLETAKGRLRAVLAEDAPSVDGFATRLMLAEAFARNGERTEAIQELRTLLLQRAEDSRNREVESMLREAGEPVAYSFGERLIRAARLGRVGRNEACVAELDAAGRPTRRAQLARWLHLRGMALYRLRTRYAEAAENLTESARLGGSTAIEDQFHAARALARSDQDDASIVAYRRFVEDHPNHSRAPLAEYLAAWLEIRHERAAGERNLRRFLSGPRGRRDAGLRRDAVWQLGFRGFERGNLRDAVRWLEQYWRLGESALVRSRGLYWLGRAKAASGDRPGAEDAYRRAVAYEPLHWYALLARQRLEALGVSLPPFPPGEPTPPSPTLDVELPPAVAFYHRLGLDEDAVAMLRAQEAQVRGAAPAGRGAEAAAVAYHRIGHFSRPYQMAATTYRDALKQPPMPANRWVWTAAYPRAFARSIESAAAAQGVRPEYLWAIMRQESGYRPEAVSHAGAIGLLQLLPETAQAAADGLGGAVEVDRSLLFIPEWNVRFAAYYNARLFEEFDQVPPLAFAAFNAGEARGHRWLRETGDIELDRFVERIPFNETRNYVRRVTSHYARYLYLQSPESGWPLTLPERVAPIVE